jgi:hypothetical protein
LKSILEEKGKFGESGGGWSLDTRGDMYRGKDFHYVFWKLEWIRAGNERRKKGIVKGRIEGSE